MEIFGILNLSPDSFSDGHLGEHLNRAKDMGADIIDVGAESTRPGSSPVSEATEKERLGNIISNLAKSHTVSIDTFKPGVAAYALEQGASIINDVSGLRANPEMVNVASSFNARLLIMHSKEDDQSPHASDKEVHYEDVAGEISNWLLDKANFAVSKGVKEENIILDPGIGAFISTRPEDSWKLLKDISRLVELVKPFPVLLGVSRKGFLGGELQDRDPLSKLVEIYAFEEGVKYIRTHNVPMLREMLRIRKELS